MEIKSPPKGKVVSRWPEAKMAGKTGLALTGVGVQVAQTALATPTVVALATAGAAASATGIGLIVVGAAATLGQIGLSAKAAHSSRIHRNNLGKIYERRGCYGCTMIGASGAAAKPHEHVYIADHILPYAIQQKESKFHRKAVGAVPGVGSLETVRAIGKNLYKRATNTLGKGRWDAASWLALHLVTHNCGLVQAIVSELYSFEEMLWLKDQDNDTVAKLLEPKLKST